MILKDIHTNTDGKEMRDMAEDNISVNISFLMVETILNKLENSGLLSDEQKNLIQDDVRKKIGAEKNFSCVMMDL